MHAFARDITSNGWIIGFARDFIDLVDIDDAALSARHIEIGGLDQAQEDVLDILTNIARFCEGGSVRDAERHIQNLGERLRQ